MINMKKFMPFASAVALTIGLAGCGTADEGDKAGGAKGGNEIEFWAYEPGSKEHKDSLNALIDEYEEANDVTVKTSYIPKDDFNTKLNSSIAVGKNPDVSYLDQPLVPKFAEDGTLLQLDEYADGENGINRTQYFTGAFDTNVVDGNLFGLPLNQTTVALFYNKDLVPTPPATWDDWVAMAEEVYAKDQIGAYEGVGTGGWAAWLFPAFVHSGGGSMVNADETEATFGEEAGVEAAELLNSLYKYSDLAVRDSQDAFGNGKLATKISGPWEIDTFKNNFPDLNFGVALIPSKEGVQSYSNIGGDNIVVYENSDSPEAAWGLVKFLTSKEHSIAVADITGNFPVQLEAAEDPKYAEDENLSVFLQQMETAVARPRLTDWLKVNDEVIGTALEEITLSGKDAKETLGAAQDRANDILFSE
ncbi:ABC transporter substrate-binding protein [Bacillus sp. SM2101]|uniref:ABC transporter substrate-binding protein n=1 Tax=Bacillus sp. SM2101 TaxID=2805366 RepID=UPI001BDEA2C3|nr:ABC transporter substrate-binding protein [Bacillus sp. SM2101]